MLAAIAVLLVIAFGGSVTALIPLYTVGVFVAFTLSQTGMVRRWRRLRAEEPAWRREATINGSAPSRPASWRSRSRRPSSSRGLGGAHPDPDPRRHDAVHRAPVSVGRRRTSRCDRTPRSPRPREERVIVPVPGINRAVVQAINVGRSIAPDVRAVLVSDDPVEAPGSANNGSVSCRTSRSCSSSRPIARWWPSPRLPRRPRSGLGSDKEAPITFVVIPEYVARSWWERSSTTKSARRLRKALLGRRHTVVVNVPYRPDEPDESLPPPRAARVSDPR